MIWMVTAILAVGIIFAAIVVSRNAAVDGGDKAASKPQTQARGTTAPAVRTAPERASGQEQQAVRQAAPDRPSAVPPVQADRGVTLSDVLQGTFSRRIEISGNRMVEGKRFPLDYTCYRQNKSPAMNWENVPPGAQSLVLILVRDRNKEGREPFLNWAVYNIDPAEKRLAASLPGKETLDNGARQTRNDHRNFGYTGPCEPKGQFPYSFYLFALDRTLPDGESLRAEDIYRLMQGHVLDYGRLDMVHFLQY